MAMQIARVEDSDLNDVEDQAHYGNNEHEVSFHLWWLKEAHGSLNNKPYRHNPNGGNRDKRTDNFGAMPSISITCVCIFGTQF